MSTVPELDPPAVAELGARLRDNIARAVKAPESVLRDVLVALFAEGHVLIEDYPGVGKTALARALARSIDAEYARIQCTADLLPADVVGTNVYNQRENRFEFRPGPGVRERRARGRGQPRLAEDAVRPARVHAGAPRDGGPAHARAGAAVHRASPRRTRSSTRAPTRCPRRSSTASWCASRSAIPSADAGEPRCSPDHAEQRPRARPRAGGGRGRACSPRRPPPAAVHGSEALRRYVVAMLGRHARRPARGARREPAGRA